MTPTCKANHVALLFGRCSVGWVCGSEIIFGISINELACRSSLNDLLQLSHRGRCDGDPPPPPACK